MDWICTAVSWLDNNSAAVMAIATVVIAYASVVSSRFVCLEKKIERANRMPILTFADERTDDHRSLYVKNVGYGPALNIVRNIIEPGDLLQTRPQDPLLLGSLAPSERVYAYAATLPPNSSVAIVDDPRFHAVVEYDDVLDGHYEFVYQGRTHSKPERITKRKMPPNQARRA